MRAGCEVFIPPIGDSITEATITLWLVDVGSRVERDQPLFEMSTDKVDAEIPSPASGILRQIVHPAGTTVPIHTVVAWIEPLSAESGEDLGAPSPSRYPPETPHARPPEDVVPQSSAQTTFHRVALGALAALLSFLLALELYGLAQRKAEISQSLLSAAFLLSILGLLVREREKRGYKLLLLASILLVVASLAARFP